jgi:hypothetical protein
MPSDDSVTRLPVRRITIDFSPESIQALEIIAQAQTASGGEPPNNTIRTNLGVQALATLIVAAGGVGHLDIMVRPHRDTGIKRRWANMSMKI